MPITRMPLFDLPSPVPRPRMAADGGEAHPTPKHRPIELHARDRAVMQAIHHYNGVLSDTQIQRLIVFGERSYERRILQLSQHGYISRRESQAGSTVNFLARKGAFEVASLKGAAIHSFKWRKPGERWPEVPHDIQTNDFVIAVEHAISQMTGVTLLESISDYEFRRFPDQVTLEGSRGGKFKYSIYPDWFFQVLATHPVTGHENRLRYLVETDMHEHSGLAFVERKVKPYAIYFDSPQYRARFGANHGQCLVMTTDDHWVTILKERTEHSGVSGINRFYFTTHAAVMASNVLTDPIWQQAGTSGPVSLLLTATRKAI